jgi:starch synthase
VLKQPDKYNRQGVTGGVVVVHPGKQHSYQVAVALQHAGELRQFITGVYYRPEKLPYSLVGWLPAALGATARRELGKRTEPMLAPSLVKSWPYAEMLSRLLGRLRLVERLSKGRSGYVFVNSMTDLYVSHLVAGMNPPPVALYGFLGSVFRTFGSARQRGIDTVLDVPIVLDAAEIMRNEYRALGLRSTVEPPPSRRLRRELMRADWVITPSRAVAESVRRAGFSGRAIFVVPYGADASVFRPADRAAKSTGFRAVFAGRLEVRKGLHYLLEAWRQAGVDGELVLAGSAGEGEFVARMRRQYGGMFREAGNLLQGELAQLLASADVFVFPSLAEGSALVTYQALAAGVPCIVTAEAGSVVRDGIEGFVVPPRNSAAIADRLKTLSSDRELRQRMAKAALERGRQFTWQSYHRKLASVVGHVLEQGGHIGTTTGVPQVN